MAKPIFLSDALIETLTREFRESISKKNMFEGEVSFKTSLQYKVTGQEDKVKVLFTANAYIKMIALVNHFDTEVGWHGTVRRLDQKTFLIDDIIVYPQQVDGTNVNTDQEEYQKWMNDLNDDYFNRMHFQGHSHVNMSTSPSQTDLTHQEGIVSQLSGDAFYIFAIWNKKMDKTMFVYDYQNNVMYPDEEVEVGISDLDLEGFLTDSSAVVSKKTYSVPNTSYYTGNPYYPKTDQTSRSTTKKKKEKTSYYGGYADFMEDMEDMK